MRERVREREEERERKRERKEKEKRKREGEYGPASYPLSFLSQKDRKTRWNSMNDHPSLLSDAGRTPEGTQGERN